jgi:two-component system, cell cycle sensor histidine kinase and response regulator CckA
MTQLHQVMMNLCVNARDAMPQGGTISIQAANRSLDQAFARTHLDAKVGNYSKFRANAPQIKSPQLMEA